MVVKKSHRPDNSVGPVRSAKVDGTGLSAQEQLDAMIDRFTPAHAKLIRSVHKRLRTLIPNAIEMVYDNYNFFVIGFVPGKRPSEAVFSIAADKNGVRLCFLQGAGLPDPNRLLVGSGTTVRNIPLKAASDLGVPAVLQLIEEAKAAARVPFLKTTQRELVIQSISPKQRPRQ